jgi:chromosome segregation ATPase
VKTPQGRPVVIHANVDDPVGPDDLFIDDVLDASGEPIDDGIQDALVEGVSTRPCAHCGRPVPQRASAGRPFRYCRDNDDACLRAARNARMRARGTPGLPGQVAQAFEVVERLDKVMETLTDALHTELSPTGVQRQLDSLRAQTAADVSAATIERDEARREAEQWQDEVARLRAELQKVRADTSRTVQMAVKEAETARRSAEEAVSLADAHIADADAAARAAQQSTADAWERVRTVEAERDEAMRVVAATQALHAEAVRDRDAARTEMADAVRSRETALAEARLQAEAAQRALAREQSARGEVTQTRAALDKAVAAAEARQTELGSLRRTLHTVEEQSKDVALRLASAEADRDAARREVEAVTREFQAARNDVEGVRKEIEVARKDAEQSRQAAAAAQTHAAALAERVGELATALTKLTRPSGRRSEGIQTS